MLRRLEAFFLGPCWYSRPSTYLQPSRSPRSHRPEEFQSPIFVHLRGSRDLRALHLKRQQDRFFSWAFPRCRPAELLATLNAQCRGMFLLIARQPNLQVGRIV